MRLAANGKARRFEGFGFAPIPDTVAILPDYGADRAKNQKGEKMMTDEQVAELEATAQANRDIVAAAPHKDEIIKDLRKSVVRLHAEKVARSIDCSLVDVEKIFVRNALGAIPARSLGATDKEVNAVVQAAYQLEKALNALSVSVRS